MKNLKRILSFFIVMGFMFVMFGFKVGVRAEGEQTITCTITSNTEVTAVDTGNIEGLTATYSQTAATLYQVTKDNSATLTITGLAGKTIKSIDLSMRSNASKGTGSLSVTAGTTTLLAFGPNTFANAAWHGSYTDSWTTVSKNMTNDTYTIRNNESLTVVISATVNSLYIQSYVIHYEEGSAEPAIEISGDDFLMIGGSGVTLSASPLNITPTPASYTWNSSNTSVATVSSSGVVAPVSMGTTNITATASGTTSAAYAVKVYPSNTTPISIATAVEIATLAGTTAAPYKYISSGTITDVADDGHSYTLTDGSGNITVYKKNHGKDINDVVTIQGDLINYGGNTLEYTNIEYCYNVTFNTNGGTGSFGPYNNVTEGSKISNPGTPTKAGYTFNGWFNGLTEWDFANDTVTGPLTLTAKWASNAAQTAINNALESANAYMSLAYSYTLNKIDNPETYTKVTSASHLSAGDSVIIISKFGSNYYVLKNNNGSAVPSEAITITNDEIDSIDSSCVWTLEGNLIDGWNLKNNSLYLYNPSSTTLNLHNSNKTTFSFTINGNNAYFESSDRAMMYYEKDATKSFKHYALSNYGKAEYAEEMYVFVKQATAKYSFREVDFRIRCAIDDSLSELNEDYAVAFGIEVSAGGNTVRYGSGSGAIFQTVGSKCFVTLDLGDMLNTNYANLDTEFTIRAYVEYNGAYFYSTNTKTYSVKGMVNQYYNVEHIDAVSGLKEILENYGYTFE